LGGATREQLSAGVIALAAGAVLYGVALAGGRPPGIAYANVPR